MGRFLFENRIEHFLPSAQPAEAGGFYDAAHTDGLIGVVCREMVELAPIFVTAGEMGEQTAECRQADPFQLADALWRKPIELGQ